MSDFEIFPAVFDDFPTIVEFNARMAAETEGKPLDHATLTNGVQAVLNDPQKGRYWVARCNEQTVGQLLVTFEWSDWRNGMIWWIQSVFVAPEYRRQGVFRSLYAHLQREASSQPGVVGLRLYVERDNQQAQATYTRLGMKNTGYLVMEDLFETTVSEDAE